MSRTADNLVSFKGYLQDRGVKNTGQPPYTIKASDLDENFLRLVVRDPSKITLQRSSDNQVVDVPPVLSFERKNSGQQATLQTLTIDVIINGVFRQAVMAASLVSED